MSRETRHAPGTADEVRDIVASAAAGRTSLEVCGGGSKRAMSACTLAAAQLDLCALSGVTDYDPEELVVTARAGTPLRELEAALEERGQMLAFEPFDHGPWFDAAPGRATLGGIVAANVSGPRRLASGAARDHVLGLTAVSGRGELIKGGGAVVKNVSGFDLPKLMTGSFGTLAVFTSITLRVVPRPPGEVTVQFPGLGDEAAIALMGAAMSMPAAVTGAAHRAGSVPLTALRLEGFGPGVQARCRDLVRELMRAVRPPCAPQVLDKEASCAFWRGVSGLDALPRAGHVLWRVSVPPASGWRVPALLQSASARYLYDWAGGLVWVSLPERDPFAANPKMRAIARSLGGRALLVRAPAALRAAERAGACGTESLVCRDPALVELHARVKSAFDPAGVLNPGLDLAADL